MIFFFNCSVLLMVIETWADMVYCLGCLIIRLGPNNVPEAVPEEPPFKFLDMTELELIVLSALLFVCLVLLGVLVCFLRKRKRNFRKRCLKPSCAVPAPSDTAAQGQLKAQPSTQPSDSADEVEIQLLSPAQSRSHSGSNARVVIASHPQTRSCPDNHARQEVAAVATNSEQQESPQKPLLQVRMSQLELQKHPAYQD